MAYYERDDFMVWLAEPLPEDVLQSNYLHLIGMESEPYSEVADPEVAFGYIIRDWFGPFLLSPPCRALRGQC